MSRIEGETYEEWAKRTILGGSAPETPPTAPKGGIPVQEHLECHIEVELSAILQRAGLPPKAMVTIVPRNVDWVAVARAGQMEVDPTDTIEVHWQSHREGAL